MTDIASLSFQIDSSNVPTATDQLNKLSDAADHVRGSVRFLVGAVGDSDQALQQLAASGRASLASFVQISQNLDVITASLNALRGAAADTIGTLGGQGLSNALSTFQQQFAAMATIFGTTTASLEAFNRQAEYLQLNSNQVGSAIQRITQAQQNQTPYGQALRSLMDQDGIQVGTDPAAVLRQIQTMFASHQLSQQSFNQLQALLGPIDPATAAAFYQQPYQSVAARRQEFLGQTLDQQASQTSSTAANLTYQNNYTRAQYNDGRPYLNDITQNDIGGGARSAFIDDLTRRIANAAKADPDVIAQQRALLTLLQGAQPGSQAAIAAESQFDILNPNDSLAQSTMSIFGRQSLGRAPLTGTPSWYERLTDQNFQNANTNYIGAAYDYRRARVGHGGFVGAIGGALQDFALNTGEDTDYILNRFGLYSGPPTGPQAPTRHIAPDGHIYYSQPNALPGMPTIQQLAQSPADIQANAQANAALAGQLGPAYAGFGEAYSGNYHFDIVSTYLALSRPEPAFKHSAMKRFLAVTAPVFLALASCASIQDEPVSRYVANEDFHTLSSCFFRNIQDDGVPYAQPSLTPLVDPTTDRVDSSYDGKTLWRVDFIPQGSGSLILVSQLPMIVGADYRWETVIKPALDPCTKYEPEPSS